jgi:L-rhamnose mutarotase
MLIKVRLDWLEEYKRLHAAVWPRVLEMIKKANIRKYSIFYKDGYLFSYFEHTGEDLDADIAKIGEDPTVQKWWAITKPMLQPLETRAEGEWWASMDEIFHMNFGSERKEGVKMKRYGMVIKVLPEKFEEYKRLHAAVWPAVLDMIGKCNIRNYSIYHKDGYLFSYFEYTGKNFPADMSKMAADLTTQKWWAVCKPCQEPLPTRKEGEWWAEMEEVFHCE